MLGCFCFVVVVVVVFVFVVVVVVVAVLLMRLPKTCVVGYTYVMCIQNLSP